MLIPMRGKDSLQQAKAWSRIESGSRDRMFPVQLFLKLTIPSTYSSLSSTRPGACQGGTRKLPQGWAASGPGMGGEWLSFIQAKDEFQ